MAAINRATLRATIRLRGDYTNVRRFPTTYLDTEIQTAFGKFYQLVADTHEGWWDIKGILTAVACQDYVALASDCWRVQAVDVGPVAPAIAPVGVTAARAEDLDDLHDVIATRRILGTIGNGKTITFTSDGTGTGTWTDGDNATFKFQPGVTKVADLVAASSASAIWAITEGSTPGSHDFVIGFVMTTAGGTDSSGQVAACDSTRWRPLRQVGLKDRNRFSVSEAEPIAFRTSARGLELFQTPDAAYQIRVHYTPKAPDLDESTAREWYNGWEDFVINAVLLELATREGKPLGDVASKLKAAADLITAGASERRSQEPEYLNLHEHGGMPYDEDY